MYSNERLFTYYIDSALYWNTIAKGLGYGV